MTFYIMPSLENLQSAPLSDAEQYEISLMFQYFVLTGTSHMLLVKEILILLYNSNSMCMKDANMRISETTQFMPIGHDE